MDAKASGLPLLDRRQQEPDVDRHGNSGARATISAGDMSQRSVRALPQAALMKTTAAVLILLASAAASAQVPATGTAAGCPLEPVKFHACAQPKMKTFSPARTADGHPDLNGYWERAFTSQDIEEHGDGLGVQAGPSLVIDTPDRRIPYRPAALELKKTMADRFISPLASCFPPGVPRHAVAPASHQILQTSGYVVHLLGTRTHTGSFRRLLDLMHQATSSSGRATHAAAGRATRWSWMSRTRMA